MTTTFQIAKQRLDRAVGSLAVRNYRFYFTGQLVSVSGNWMQQIAIAWLVLRLTNSAFSLGVTWSLQTVPYLLVGTWGGLLVDRLPKRRVLILTQSLHATPALALFLLTQTGVVRIWMVYAAVLCRGLVNTVDNPARQSLVSEIVGPGRLVNAVSLNSAISQGGRLFGPAVGTAIIAVFGLGACFLVNSLTFVFMATMLTLMRPGELHPAPVTARGKGQLRQGWALVARTPDLRVPLILMAIVGLLSFNFQVVLPAVARFTYHGTATTYALMMNFLAAGALVGAVLSATRRVVTRRAVSWGALGFGAALAVASAVDDLRIALAALLAVGSMSVTFSASVQSVLQLAVPHEMRGRILSLYQLVYQGTSPLGALIVGALASTIGARSGLAVGAVAGVTAGAYGLWESRAGAPGVTVRTG